MVQPIPTGCNSINAYVIVKDGQQAMDFYAQAFGGESGMCMMGPDGSFMHGEVRIGNSTLMVTQENPQWELKSAATLGGSPVSLHLYVEDCDSSFRQAIAAGCQELVPVRDMFWGDRYGKVLDPFGLQWGIATHVEDVSDEEMHRRGEAWAKQQAAEK